MHFQESKHMDTGHAVRIHVVTKLVINIIIADYVKPIQYI